MTTNTAVQTMKKVQEETVNAVLARVSEFQKNGQLTLPKDFSPENALKAAWFTLMETKDRSSKPVLESCTKESITNSLFEMILQGLNPMKKQCAFIAYGDRLTMVREYHGTIALAKRFGGVKNVYGHVIYKNDVFEYSFNKETGRKDIVKHEQDFKNIDNDNILGAYAVLILEDGSHYVEIMNIKQIKQAWLQGAANGNSPAHKNFPDEMAKKTVINRACKLFISSSDDGSIIDLNKEGAPKDIVPSTANEETIDIDGEDVTEKEKPNDSDAPVEKKEPVKKEESENQPKGPTQTKPKF
jgi:recombination protein RecT